MAKNIVLDNMPTKKSGQEVWLAWYDVLKAKLPNAAAKQLWVKAWSKFGGKDSPAYTQQLRAEMGKNGIDIEKSNTAFVLDTAKGGFDFVQDFFVAGKWTTIIVVGGASLAVLVLLFNIARKPIESAKAAADLTRAIGSRGMA